MTAEPRALLPDVAGRTHGIVQVEPFIRIQCDGCGYIHDGAPGKAALAVLTCGIKFNTRAHARGDQRRLCVDCRRRKWAEQETS